FAFDESEFYPELEDRTIAQEDPNIQNNDDPDSNGDGVGETTNQENSDNDDSQYGQIGQELNRDESGNTPDRTSPEDNTRIIIPDFNQTISQPYVISFKNSITSAPPVHFNRSDEECHWSSFRNGRLVDYSSSSEEGDFQDEFQNITEDSLEETVFTGSDEVVDADQEIDAVIITTPTPSS
ncbi:unnamed protein product, partial [Allacma fusca]